MDILTLLFALATFIAVVLFLEGGYLWWASTHSAEVKRLNRRLEEVTTGIQSARTASLYKELNATGSAAGDRLLHAITHLEGVNRMIVQSRLSLTLTQFLGWTVALAALGFALPVLLNRPVFIGLIAGGVLAMLPT